MTPSTLGTCRWARSQLMSYALVMLFGSTTRKRIASSGPRSSTVASSLSCALVVSTSPTRLGSRCRGPARKAPRHGRGLSRAKHHTLAP